MVMKRYLVVVALVILSATPGLLWAQGVPSSLGLDNIQIEPSAKIYYKQLGLNLNFGVAAQQVLSPFAQRTIGPLVVGRQWGTLLDAFPLELSLTEGRFAVGELGLKIGNGGRAAFIGSIAASLPTKTGVQSAIGPGIGVLTTQGRSWVGSNAQWWGIDVGGSFEKYPGFEFLAGLKLESTTLRMSDPDPDGSYNYLVWIGTTFTIHNTLDDLSGDLQVNLTIPYIGVKMDGGQYRSAFRIGIAGANVTSPIRLTDSGLYHAFWFLGWWGRSDISEEACYSFANAGLYVDGSFEFDVDVTEGFGLTCWAQATWLNIPGAGSVDLEGRSSESFFPLFGGPNLPPTSFGASGSSRESGVSQYSLNIGFTGNLTF
jgi:hypothetical protein